MRLRKAKFVWRIYPIFFRFSTQSKASVEVNECIQCSMDDITLEKYRLSENDINKIHRISSSSDRTVNKYIFCQATHNKKYYTEFPINWTYGWLKVYAFNALLHMAWCFLYRVYGFLKKRSPQSPLHTPFYRSRRRRHRSNNWLFIRNKIAFVGSFFFSFYRPAVIVGSAARSRH